MTQRFSLWLEGHGAQGSPSEAQFLGDYTAATFEGAVLAWNSHENTDDVYGKLSFKNGRYTVWGCQVFDNEEEARKGFG